MCSWAASISKCAVVRLGNCYKRFQYFNLVWFFFSSLHLRHQMFWYFIVQYKPLLEACHILASLAQQPENILNRIIKLYSLFNLCTTVLCSMSLSLREVWSSNLFKHFWPLAEQSQLTCIPDLNYIEKAHLETLIRQESDQNEVQVLFLKWHNH